MTGEPWNGWYPEHVVLLIVLLAIGAYCVVDMIRMDRRK